MPWTKSDDPLKVGHHPAEQCARGRNDCRSLHQIVSSAEPFTFVCCGEVAPDGRIDPNDKWSLCVKGRDDRQHCAGTDMRIFIDQRDMAHVAAVCAASAAIVIDDMQD